MIAQRWPLLLVPCWSDEGGNKSFTGLCPTRGLAYLPASAVPCRVIYTILAVSVPRM